MKKILPSLLLIFIILPLLADNHLLNKGQHGVFIDAMKTSSKWTFDIVEFSAGYTFKHGSSFRGICAYYPDEFWYGDVEYPPYPPSRIWYYKAGLEYGFVINDQEKGKLPIDISLDGGYYFNKCIGDYGEGSDAEERASHTIKIGISTSRDFKLFNKIDIIPIVSGNLYQHIDVLIPGMESGSCMGTAVLSGKLIVKYNFLYAFAQYDMEYNPYDCISLYSFYNIGWHGGLGLLFTLR